jgi:uncharacterized membrane protein YdjX (TVP38/TMEM64 family)
MNRKILKIGILLLLLAFVAVFFALDLTRYASLEFIKSQQQALQQYHAQHPLITLAIFALAYITVTALSLPAAAALTLLGGALFGFVTGLIVISFASTIGATLAFLTARFLLKDFVQKKYGKHLGRINEGFAREGAFYLFALRLVPVIPFFMVNILMAFVPIQTHTFYIVSQAGMLAGTAVYVYAGTALGNISAFSDIVSPRLALAFALLGFFPLAAKKALDFLRTRKIA